MTIGQANALVLLNSMIKWSLLPMIIILVIAIVQYSVYQPWWRDPIGFMIVFLEIAILVQVAPQEYAQWFIHSVGAEITMGFVVVALSMLVTVGLIGRVIVWGIEWHKAAMRDRQDETRQRQ